MKTLITDSTAFTYSSDMSGDVEVMLLEDKSTMMVPGADLLAFMAEVVRLRRIAELETASDEEILGARFPVLAEDE